MYRDSSEIVDEQRTEASFSWRSRFPHEKSGPSPLDVLRSFPAESKPWLMVCMNEMGLKMKRSRLTMDVNVRGDTTVSVRSKWFRYGYNAHRQKYDVGMKLAS